MVPSTRTAGDLETHNVDNMSNDVLSLQYAIAHGVVTFHSPNLIGINLGDRFHHGYADSLVSSLIGGKPGFDRRIQANLPNGTQLALYRALCLHV